MPVVSVFPLALARVVSSARERGPHDPFLQASIPAAMVPVQMGIDDHIDALWVDALIGNQIGKRVQARRQLHPLSRPAVHLVSATGLDEDGVLSGLHHVAIESQRHQVAPIRRKLLAPERLRHHAEKGSTVPMIHTGPDEGDAKGTQRNAGHKEWKLSPSELAAALENIGCLVGELAAAVEKV